MIGVTGRGVAPQLLDVAAHAGLERRFPVAEQVVRSADARRNVVPSDDRLARERPDTGKNWPGGCTRSGSRRRDIVAHAGVHRQPPERRLILREERQLRVQPKGIGVGQIPVGDARGAASRDEVADVPLLWRPP